MIENYLSAVSKAVESWVGANFHSDAPQTGRLYEAMAYSLNAGGKRLRPALLLMAYNLFDNREINENHPAMPFAAAVEMVHTYSLIHDDLPAMDDDDLRRGKPTNHVVFGEATAILAGDGLLTKAFEIFLHPSSAISAERRAAAAYEMLKASGADGMVGGQFADMQAQGGSEDAALLDYIHMHKTAVLITGAILAGGLLAGAGAEDVLRLRVYGNSIGMAFQITDDILDVVSDTATLGKPAGSDEELDKLTYVKIYGLEAAKTAADKYVAAAIDAVQGYGGAGSVFVELAQFISERKS